MRREGCGRDVGTTDIKCYKQTSSELEISWSPSTCHKISCEMVGVQNRAHWVSSTGPGRPT